MQIKSQLQVSSSDYDSLQQRCCECRATIKLLQQLVQVCDEFEAIQEMIASENYEESTQVHMSVGEILTDIHAIYGNDVTVLQCLLSKHVSLEEKLETCVMRRWKEVVSWSSPPTELAFASGPDAHQELQHISQSLHNLGCLSGIMAKFASQVMAQFVDTLLSDGDTLYDIEIQSDSSSGSLKVVKVTSGEMNAMAKLQSFTLMMEMLYENLLNITIADAKPGNGSLRDAASAAGRVQDEVMSSRSVKLMSMFADECSSTCLEALITRCLSSAIPSHRSDLAQFSQVAAAVEDLHQKLVEFGFIEDDNKALLDYVKNVDVLFANKRSVELLDEARTIIKSNVHNIVQVTVLLITMEMLT